MTYKKIGLRKKLTDKPLDRLWFVKVDDDEKKDPYAKSFGRRYFVDEQFISIFVRRDYGGVFLSPKGNEALLSDELVLVFNKEVDIDAFIANLEAMKARLNKGEK